MSDDTPRGPMIPIVLTIAGFDPSGGAGLQADLKTFHQFGVYGMSVVTVLTVQNTERVSSVDPLDPGYVRQQLDSLMEDLPPRAAKTGALGTAGIIEIVAEWARGAPCPLVVDPVMVSTHGVPLMDENARRTLRRELLPSAYLVTPNLYEAAVLSGMKVDDLASMEQAARKIAETGCQAVWVTGGHLTGQAADILYFEGEIHTLTSRRIDTKHTHGTGCTSSAALTAELAKGTSLVEAVGRAKRFISRAIETAPGLGHGHGPVNHHAPLDELDELDEPR